MSFYERKEASVFVQDGGLILAVSATSASQVVKPGRRYRISCSNPSATVPSGGALCSFQSTVTNADGGFDFVVHAGESIDIVATSAACHALEMQTQDVVLFFQEYRD